LTLRLSAQQKLLHQEGGALDYQPATAIGAYQVDRGRLFNPPANLPKRPEQSNLR
jgi:hypothetical protein